MNVKKIEIKIQFGLQNVHARNNSKLDCYFFFDLSEISLLELILTYHFYSAESHVHFTDTSIWLFKPI